MPGSWEVASLQHVTRYLQPVSTYWRPPFSSFPRRMESSNGNRLFARSYSWITDFSMMTTGNGNAGLVDHSPMRATYPQDPVTNQL